MKNASLVFLLVLLGTTLSFAQEIEQKEDINSFSAECAFTPKYIWRGITYTDGLAIQPFISFSQNNLSIQFWSNLVAKDTSATPVNEVDIYVNYNYELYGLTLTPSFFYYTYPGQGSNSTAEINLALSYSIGNFTFGTSIAKDILEISHAMSGYHDIKFSMDLFENATLNLSTGFGWGNQQFNEYYIGLDKAALNYGLVNGSLSYTISEKFSVRPYFEYYTILDQDIKDILGGNTFNFGIAIGVEL